MMNYKGTLKKLFFYDEGEFRCTAKSIRDIGPEPSEDQEHPWNDLSLVSYSSGFSLADGKDHNVSGCIYAESYKIYLAGTNTKLELFRKSDGVNISRVNDYVGVYRDVPVTTYTKNRLLAKFSWLNTANEDREFFITITQYDRKRELVSSNPVWCYKVTTPKGDDGYTLIDLPYIHKDTRLLRVQYSDVDVTREPDGVCTGEDHFIPIESVGIPIIRRPLPLPLPRPTLPGATIVGNDDNDGIEALPDYPSIDLPIKEPDHPIDDSEIKPPIDPPFLKPPIPPHLLK